jgi:hypothetical protein
VIIGQDLMVIVLFRVKVIMPYRTKGSVRFIANIIIAKNSFYSTYYND